MLNNNNFACVISLIAISRLLPASIGRGYLSQNINAENNDRKVSPLPDHF